MYVDSAAVCTYDPNDNSSMPESTPEVVLNNNFAPNVDECHQINDLHHTTIEFDLQNEIDFSTMNHNSSNSHLVSFENHQPTNWDNEIQQSQLPVNGANATYSLVSAPDFLSLVHLPSSSFVLPNTSISFTNPNDFSGYFTPSETAVDETMLHLNQLHQQQQPPFIRELLQSLPNGYNMGGISNGSNLFSNGGDEAEDGRQLFENGDLEFSKEMKRSGKGKGGNKATNTERERRVQFGGKFTKLRKLVPNPSKRQTRTEHRKPKMCVDSATTAGCNFDPDTTTNSESAEPEVVLNIIPESLNNSIAHVDEENLKRVFMEELNNNNNINPHVVSFEIHQQPTNWDNTIQQHSQLPDHKAYYAAPYPQPKLDLLSLFHLPSSSSVLPNLSISFTNPNGFPGPFGPETPSGDMFHLNQPPPQPQLPLFRELLQSLPHGYNLDGISNGGLTMFSNSGDEGDEGRQLFENRVLKFSKEMKPFGRGRDGNKVTKHFASERHRRVQLNEKYTALKELVPNPTKADRASIVGDAITYIEKLKSEVDELKLLVEKKRCERERKKRQRTKQDGGAVAESCNMKPIIDPLDQSYHNGSLRSSRLQRKSKDTEVDVRIIDDEVTIKLVQRKKINLLLSMSKLLDELQLQLHHAAGGQIGNSYSFLFNTKMCEGSSLYASAIANKLMEVLDRQYDAISQKNSY